MSFGSGCVLYFERRCLKFSLPLIRFYVEKTHQTWRIGRINDGRTNGRRKNSGKTAVRLYGRTKKS